MDTNSPNKKFIDIEEVIRKKNPRLLKIFPKFLIKGFKKIIYQDEVNNAIENNKNSEGLHFVSGILNDFGTRYEVSGYENIPDTGRFIFAANHPLGGLDGMVLMDAIGKKYPNVKFIVNDLLLNIKNLESLFIPVNKHGRQSVDYARRIEEAYNSDVQVLYFPAGLCSRKIKGVITDLQWHKNFIIKAIQSHRDIIPVYIEGRNTNFFYNLANLRKFMGIKVNIEMVFLVGEMFKQRKKIIHLQIGKPIPVSTFDSSKHPSEWAEFVREKVYAMRKSYQGKIL